MNKGRPLESGVRLSVELLGSAPPIDSEEEGMSRRECMNVKVEAELVRKAKVVAAARWVALTDYISDLLRAQVERDLAGVAAGLIGAAAVQATQPGQQDQGAVSAAQ